MTDSSNTATQTVPDIGAIPRPPFQLPSLPICFRWEVTRRHPYYQDWWRYAQAHYRKEPSEHPAEPMVRQAAAAILGAIGIAGVAPDPATDFEELGATEMNSAWLSGSIRPITPRGLAGLLIATLPKDTASYIGMLLLQASRDEEEDESPRQIQALLDLSRLDKPGLNDYLDEPIVAVNPAASARQVTEDISNLQQQWKVERNLSEQRDRSDKYPLYLRVWDMREGFVDGVYDRTQERTLRDIATEFGRSINTIHNQYRAAFEMVTGQRYSPEMWNRLMGPLKLSELWGTEAAAVSRSRPISARTTRDVPESVVWSRSEEGHHDSPMAVQTATSNDRDVHSLISDIRQLIGQGYSDERIVERLELAEKALPAVAYLREHEEIPV